MLAERVPPEVALEAVLGWGGDRYRQVLVDGASCVQLRFVGDTTSDRDEMASTLDQWRSRLPHRRLVRIAREQRAVTVEACDPGDSTGDLTTGDMEDAFELALVRIQIMRAGVERWSLAAATCVADETTLELPADDLLGTLSDLSRRRYDQIIETCTGDDATQPD